MKKSNMKKGFTLAEVLVVIGILAVIAAFGMIAVSNYLRSMTKIEYDSYAKELFIAAQNNLTMAESQGYLGREHGNEESILGDDSKGVRYFVVDSTGRPLLNDSSSVLNLILPAGSIDETIRNSSRSCYIVRYHADAGQVLDVYYWSPEGRFGHTYRAIDYNTWVSHLHTLYSSYYIEVDLVNQEDLTVQQKKQEIENLNKKLDKDINSFFRNYNNSGSVIGYYGGEEAKSLTRGEKLEPPTIIVENGDKLTVRIPDPDPDSLNSDAKLALTITGDGGGYAVINLDKHSALPANVVYDDVKKEYIVILDDVTQTGMSFNELFCDDTKTDHPMTPGEDIVIQAKVYDNTQLTNVAKSPEQKTNSLFGAVTKDGGENVAQIGSFRHFMNLSGKTSGVSEADFASARQFTDIDWESFKANTDDTIEYSPLERESAIKYDGQDSENRGHIIRNLTVTATNEDGETDPTKIPKAGLFAELPNGSSVSDLKLEDLTVSGYGYTGALAGIAIGTEITNVEVYNSDGGTSTVTCLGNGSVGGLVGTAVGGKIENSSASVIVSGENGNVGGLAGTVSLADVISCYTGGHTSGGAYDPDHPNVSGKGNVGGLIGELIGSSDGSGTYGNVECCYSTCSAEGGTVGGLIGKSSGSVGYSYAVGAVYSSTSTGTGALIGTQDGINKVDNCWIYDLINESWDDTASEYKYLPAVGNASAGDRVKAIDKDADSYEAFIGGTRENASPYENLGAKYPYLTVGQLREIADPTHTAEGDELVHIGDWPSPETDIVNEN